MEVDATSHVHSNFKYKVDISSLMDSCRVCMAQSLNMSSIFDAEKENIIEEILFCTGITVSTILLNIILGSEQTKATCLIFSNHARFSSRLGRDLPTSTSTLATFGFSLSDLY